MTYYPVVSETYDDLVRGLLAELIASLERRLAAEDEMDRREGRDDGLGRR